MAGINNYKDLSIWQRGMDLSLSIYKTTRDFPKEELYGMSVQMRRSALSIPSNIAEGFNRKYGKEFKRFLNISLASLAELETQIILASRLEYVTQEKAKILLDEADALGKMINKFAQGVRIKDSTG